MKTYFSRAKTPSATLSLPLIADMNMQRIFTNIKATNDKATTYINFHKTKLIKTSSANAASGQKVMACTATAGVVANDLVIIQDAVDKTLFEYNVIGVVAANVSYTMTTNLANTYAAGSKIHAVCITGGTTAPEYVINVGAATVQEICAEGVFVAEKNVAVLMQFDSCTAACSYYAVGFQRS
jgi:hypothetical protein